MMAMVAVIMALALSIMALIATTALKELMAMSVRMAVPLADMLLPMLSMESMGRTWNRLVNGRSNLEPGCRTTLFAAEYGNDSQEDIECQSCQE
jgi:hypothetical protein